MYNYEKMYNDFKKYELVRRSGEFNMFTEYSQAAKKAKLSDSKYQKILVRYDYIKNEIERRFGSVDEFLNQ